MRLHTNHPIVCPWINFRTDHEPRLFLGNQKGFLIAYRQSWLENNTYALWEIPGLQNVFCALDLEQTKPFTVWRFPQKSYPGNITYEVFLQIIAWYRQILLNEIWILNFINIIKYCNIKVKSNWKKKKKTNKKEKKLYVEKSQNVSLKLNEIRQSTVWL